MSVISGFKEFIARGNVVDLAVAVVLGSALTAVVNSVVDSLINPLIAAVFQAPDLAQAGMFHVGKTAFYPGAVLGAIINFVIVAAAVYFFIVLPLTRISARLARRKPEPPAEPTPEEQLLTEIRDLLARDQRPWPYAGGN